MNEGIKALIYILIGTELIRKNVDDFVDFVFEILNKIIKR